MLGRLSNELCYKIRRLIYGASGSNHVWFSLFELCN